MTNRLSTEILINLAGNLTAKARQYGANMSEFATRNQRAMSVVKATSEAAGRGLDALGTRYTAMIAGLASGVMLREYAQVDRQITRLGIAAGKSRDEMHSIFSGIQDTAIRFRVDDTEVMAALENVNKMTGDLDFGVKNKDMMAASIAASGGDGASIGGLFAAFQKFDTKDDRENLLAMDILNNLGKEGGFELKDFAEKGILNRTGFLGES